MLEANYWTKRFGRRNLLRGAGVLGAGLAGAALIGCGGGDDDDDTVAATTAPTGAAGDGQAQATATAAVGEQVKRGGELKYDIAGDPPNFDMHANSTYRVNNLISLNYNQLIRFDPFKPSEPPDAVVPDLAESWESSPDGQTFTFHLVQNAKFHNGQAFTSADIKATFERVADPPEGVVSPREGQFAAITSIETPDDFTVILNLSRPSPALLPVIAQGWMSIYSAEDILGDFDFKLDYNGTGPFRVENYQRGNRFETVRNEEYFKEGLPYLDAVTVFIIPDSSTRLANFQSGELDILRGPTVTDAKALKDSLGDKIIIDGPMPSYGFGSINFGQTDPLWRDVRVRRAFSMAMNRVAAIELLNQGQGFFGGYLMPGGVWGIPTEELRAIPGYQPVTDETTAEARKLLDAAGMPESKDVSILTRQGQSYENLSIFIQDQLKAIGVNATANVQETASAYDALNSRSFDLAPWSHGYAVDDPDAIYAEFYTDGAPRNYSEISSPEIEDLFLKQSIALDFEERHELAQQLEVLALQQFGKIATTWSSGREARWPRVMNRQRHSSSYNNKRFEEVWLDV